LEVEFVLQEMRGVRVTLTCCDVHRATLPSVEPNVFMSEVEIEDLSKDQWEGVSWRVRDFGESGFLVECRKVEIAVRVEPEQ
jgi:hypothetical protein